MSFAVEEEGLSMTTVNKSIVALMNLWRTETNCPEILQFDNDLVSEVKGQLLAQQAAIDDIMADADPNAHFTVTIYQMDMERVTYSLSRYLRTRILKIEEKMDFILTNINCRELLSHDERDFLSRLSQLNSTCCNDTVSMRLNEDVRKYYESNDDRVKGSAPDLEEFVFCRAIRPVSVPVSVDEGLKNIGAGDINILRYSAIQNTVRNGQMQLL
jgi:hypothetical protein